MPVEQVSLVALVREFGPAIAYATFGMVMMAGAFWFLLKRFADGVTNQTTAVKEIATSLSQVTNHLNNLHQQGGATLDALRTLATEFRTESAKRDEQHKFNVERMRMQDEMWRDWMFDDRRAANPKPEERQNEQIRQSVSRIKARKAKRA